MFNFFKAEFKRAIFSKNMLFAFIICILSFLFSLNNMLFHDYRGVTYSYELSVYGGVISILAVMVSAIPFSTSYIDEYSSNYCMYIKHKIGSFKYISTKFMVNFIAGGLALFIPFILYYLFLLALKGISFEDLDYLSETNKTLGYIFKQSQVQYMILKIFLTSICGATLATLALGVSIYIRNKYLVIVFPFLCYVGSAMFLTEYNLSAQMLFNLDRDPHISMNYRLIYALAIVLVSIIIFIVKYVMEDNKC
nr:hypothetical protein [uncultured Romboutsia sp.]